MRWISCGALSLLLAGSSRYAIGGSMAWISICAWLPHFLFSMQGGTKSDPIMVSLPLLFPLLRRANAKSLVVLLLVFASSVTFLVPFSNEWRRANWENWGGNEQASILTVAGRVFDSWSTSGIGSSLAVSGRHITLRSSSAEGGGTVMAVAERDGKIGMTPLDGFVGIFIPRVLWPDKPIFAPGAWFTWYLGEADSVETATSATATYLSTEFYWMYGYLGVLVGIAAVAALNFAAIKWLSKPAPDSALRSSSILMFLVGSGGLIESHVVYALSSPIISALLIAGIGVIFRILSAKSY